MIFWSIDFIRKSEKTSYWVRFLIVTSPKKTGPNTSANSLTFWKPIYLASQNSKESASDKEKSKKAEFAKGKSEIIYMNGVDAVFYFKDGTILNVTSKFGTYNNKTLDMIFEENIIANYGDSSLTAKNAEYSNSKGLLTITNKVKINDNRGNLVADKLLFDLKNQTLNIASLSKSKINAKIKLNEKRF